jgi:hypothetical protein
MTKTVLYPLIVTSVIVLTWLGRLNAQQSRGETISIGTDDIGGVVTGTNGPEAGVWVIAETADLPTKFVKIVVTDDKGRYVLPQLPKANYRVWVRGYGLLDSSPVQATPGKIVNLSAVVAPNARAAAEYYPAIFWFSLLRVPDESEFPGTGPRALDDYAQQDDIIRIVIEVSLVVANANGKRYKRQFWANPRILVGWSAKKVTGLLPACPA